MISDEDVDRLREQCDLTAEGFLRSAADTPSAAAARVMRAKAATWVTVRQMLEEADSR